MHEERRTLLLNVGLKIKVLLLFDIVRVVGIKILNNRLFALHLPFVFALSGKWGRDSLVRFILKGVRLDFIGVGEEY